VGSNPTGPTSRSCLVDDLRSSSQWAAIFTWGPSPQTPTVLVGVGGVTVVFSDVVYHLDRLAGNYCNGFKIAIVAQQRKPFAFCGGRDQQVDGTR
jgi:hypothetical protein